MALTLRRRGMRVDRRLYAEPDTIRYRQPDQPPDDYIVESTTEPARPPVSLQIVRVLQAVLIAAIALLSLAVFWMIGLILGIF